MPLRPTNTLLLCALCVHVSMTSECHHVADKLCYRMMVTKDKLNMLFTDDGRIDGHKLLVDRFLMKNTDLACSLIQ